MTRGRFQPIARTTNRVLASGLLVALALAGCSGECDEEGQSDAVKRGAERLAEEQRTNDLHIWPSEVTALRHESWMAGIWDQLRAAPEPERLGLVGELAPVAKIALPPRGAPEPVEGGGNVVKTMAGSAEAWDFHRWREALGALAAEGWRLSLIDLRQSRFRPAERNQPVAQSGVVFTFGLTNVKTAKRRVIRGAAVIHWGIPLPGEPSPTIREVGVTQAAVHDRDDPGWFEAKQRFAVASEDNQHPARMAPVIARDLNGDLSPELMLVGVNALVRFQGDGFVKSDLFQPPQALHPVGVAEDFTEDGVVDFLGVRANGEGALFPGKGDGTFGAPSKPWEFIAANPSVLTAGDIDRDGDLDVWLAQSLSPYNSGQLPVSIDDAKDGPPAVLLRNQGGGKFEPIPLEDSAISSGSARSTSLLAHTRRTMAGSFVDVDADGDLDLICASHYSGCQAYLNDGRGNFALSTSVFGGSPMLAHGFALGQFGGDSRLDLFVAGEWSPAVNRLAEQRAERADFPRYHEAAADVANGSRVYVRGRETVGGASHTGWRLSPRDEAIFSGEALSDPSISPSWAGCVSACDFDNDGDDDVFMGAGYLSGSSAVEFDSQFWRHDVFLAKGVDARVLAGFFEDAKLSPQLARLRRGEISWHGHEPDRLLMQTNGKFQDVAFLHGVEPLGDTPGALATDLNGDGALDLIALEEEHVASPAGLQPRQSVQIYLSRRPSANHWLAVRLADGVPGHHPVGARVILRGSFGERERVLLTGEGRFTQGQAVAHFGLGAVESVRSVEILWPNGRKQALAPPGVDRYIDVRPALSFTPIPEPPEPPPPATPVGPDA